MKAERKVWVVIVMMCSGTDTEHTYISEVKVFDTKESKDKWIEVFQSYNHWGVTEIYDEEHIIKLSET